MIKIFNNYCINKILALLLFIFIGCRDVFPQYSMGNRGMLNTPSAEMNETGTFVIGGNYLPKSIVPFDYNTGNYFVGITIFSFMEVTYRPTLIMTDFMREEPELRQQDRSFAIKLRAIKEGKYIPAIAIGGHDVFGTGFFRGYYGVMTKHFEMGNNEIGVSAGYLGFTSKDSKLNNGVFGGITFRPAFYRDLTFIAEYDTENINVGAAVRLWKHVSLHAFTNGFKHLSGGLRYECTLIH